MFIALNKLVFNGQHVGYRVKHDIFGVCDISLDDLQVIAEDYYTYLRDIQEDFYSARFNTSSIGGDIHLVDNGGQLVPQNAKNVAELTYAKYCVHKGHSHMEGTDTDLKKMYNHYNKLIFNNQLPKFVKLYWSNRMTRGAGVARWRKRNGVVQQEIALSVPYHQKLPHEIVDTLVHEMIHVKYPREHHGVWFKNEMHRINHEFGMNITIYATERATEKKANYIYACRECGYEYKRVRRHKNDYAFAKCGAPSCRGGLYLKQNNVDSDDGFDDTDWGQGTAW